MTRNFDPNLWRDRWVEELPYDHKNVFIYLSMCPFGSQCGAFPITSKMIANDLEIPGGRARVEEILPEICKVDKWGETHVTWWPELGFVFVNAFFRRQCTNANAKFAIGAARNADTLPTVVRTAFFAQYPELETVLETHPIRVKSAKSDGGQESIAYTENTDSLSNNPDSLYAKQGEAMPPTRAHAQISRTQYSVLSTQESGFRTQDGAAEDGAPNPGDDAPTSLASQAEPDDAGNGLASDDQRAKRFVPPTVEQAEAYFERWRVTQNLPEFPPPNPGYRSHAAEFVDHHSLRNWILTNRRKASEWEGCARTWISRIWRFSSHPSRPQSGGKQPIDLRERAAETFDRVLAQERARQNRGTS